MNKHALRDAIIGVLVLICLILLLFIPGKDSPYNYKQPKQIKQTQNSLPTACSDDIFQKIFPNQATCPVVNPVPKEIQDLPYVILPTNEIYNTVRFNFNKRFNVFPLAIFMPKNPSAVADTLKILLKYKLPFSIRSGGHCYEPGSLSSGYIIDLRNLNDIQVDTYRQEVSVGAACTVGSIIDKLGKFDYAIPTSACQSVAISGLSLGGGIGMLTRPFGLTCDSIKSITMVTADAEIIEIDEKNYPDLFWALRGAGNGSYGIVVGLKFKMYPVSKVTTFALNWNWDTATVIRIFHAWNTWIKLLPDTITPQLQLWYANGKQNIAITGVKIGSEPFTEWESAFKDLHPEVNVYPEHYVDSAKRWTGTPLFPFYKTKSRMLVDPFSIDSIQVIINFMDQLRKSKEQFHMYFEIAALGGKMAQGNINTAFYPRNALAYFQQTVYWNQQTQEAKSLNYVRQFYADISKFTSKYSYANTVDYDLGKNFMEVYYGDHSNQLMEIKRKYDPLNVFSWEQSIPLTK